MNREILFRGKRKDNGEWVEGYVTRIKHSDNKGKVESYYFNALDEMGWVAECVVSAETVCQYTGLTDKNGRKIFEGDILKTSEYGVDDGNGHNYAGFDTFSVEFSDGSFCLMNKWRRFSLRPLRDFEVYGNIFDNPDPIGGQP